MQESSPEIRSQEGMHFQFDQELLQVLASVYFQLIMVFNLTLFRLEPFFVSRISFRPTIHFQKRSTSQVRPIPIEK